MKHIDKIMPSHIVLNLEVSFMKKIFLSSLVLLTLFISNYSYAGHTRLTCSLDGVTSFFVINGGGKYGTMDCSDGYTPTYYKVAFSGIGIGASASALEGIFLQYFGFSSDIAGTYYGLRADAYLVAGVNVAFLYGNSGFLSVLGGDLLALGADVAFVRFIIGPDLESVRAAIAKLEGVSPEEVE